MLSHTSAWQQIARYISDFCLLQVEEDASLEKLQAQSLDLFNQMTSVTNPELKVVLVPKDYFSQKINKVRCPKFSDA